MGFLVLLNFFAKNSDFTSFNFFLILKNNYFRLCAIFSKKNVYSDFMYQSLLIPDNFYFIYYNLYT